MDLDVFLSFIIVFIKITWIVYSMLIYLLNILTINFVLLHNLMLYTFHCINRIIFYTLIYMCLICLASLGMIYRGLFILVILNFRLLYYLKSTLYTWIRLRNCHMLFLIFSLCSLYLWQYDQLMGHRPKVLDLHLVKQINHHHS